MRDPGSLGQPAAVGQQSLGGPEFSVGPSQLVFGSRLPRRISHTQVLYDEILERMGEGVVAIDRRGRILLANAEARRLLN